MRLVYVDEAGLSNESQEPFLVVAGIMIHADDELLPLERKLQQLVEKWIPEPERNGFVFHAKDLFNGGGIFHRDNPNWPRDRRRQLAGELAILLSESGAILTLGVVEKSKHPRPDGCSKSLWTTRLHGIGFTGCALVAEHWLRANCPDEICMMISEDNAQARSIIRDLMRISQDERTAGFFSEKYAHLFPLRHIREDPLFQPKRSSSVLQLADFWAYVAKKHYMGADWYEPFWAFLSANLAPAVFYDLEPVV